MVAVKMGEEDMAQTVGLKAVTLESDLGTLAAVYHHEVVAVIDDRARRLMVQRRLCRTASEGMYGEICHL